MYLIASFSFRCARHTSTNGSYPTGLFFAFENFSSASHWLWSAITWICSHQYFRSGTLKSPFTFSATRMSPNRKSFVMVCATDKFKKEVEYFSEKSFCNLVNLRASSHSSASTGWWPFLYAVAAADSLMPKFSGWRGREMKVISMTVNRIKSN